MAERHRKRTSSWWATLTLAITLAGLAVWMGCEKQPARTEHSSNESARPTPGPIENPGQLTQSDPTQTNANPPASAKTLEEVIATARNWGPIGASSYGKDAPEFTLTDIAGKQHKLSDYRGKDVMMVLWATWCPPCRMTVPYLIELRRTVSEADLAILGVSYITTYPPNTEKMIRQFAADEKMNYTVVAADADAVGAPYNAVNSLPTIFFVDPEGKMKLISTGLMRLDEMQAVLQAE